MPSQANDQGWILHSLAQSRRFGPMTEDELRGYFRAGMVKSVDRLSAPGESELLSAAEVATLLGVAVPSGPPPPEPTGSPMPPPSIAVAVARDPASEERVARAAAAMNIDVAALMASSAPAQPRSVWLLPTVIVVLMVLALMMGLSMLRKLKSPAAQSPGVTATQGETAPVVSDVADAPVSADPEATAPPQAVVAAAASAGDPDFDARAARARALQGARDWAGLAAFAQEWAQSSPARNEPLNYLAIAYAGLGDYKRAAEPLQKLLAREPGNANARALLAEAYLQTQSWADAAALYKQMVMESPKDARQWNNYGAALSGAGEQAQAVAALETAVGLDPTFKQAWTNLGNVYQSKGDTARASAAFANAR